LIFLLFIDYLGVSLNLFYLEVVSEKNAITGFYKKIMFRGYYPKEEH